MSNTKVYGAWCATHYRCGSSSSSNYKNYGARGIKVCERWNFFENFYADMGDPPSKDSSLDRVDNNADYSPENCRWATRKEQSNNRNFCKSITAFGETKNIAQWAEDPRCTVSYATLYARLIKLGFSAEMAISMKRIKPNPTCTGLSRFRNE